MISVANDFLDSRELDIVLYRNYYLDNKYEYEHSDQLWHQHKLWHDWSLFVLVKVIRSPHGLNASTTYDFQVSSTDSQGRNAISSNQAFTTAAYTYYVDSVNGSDSNPGTSPSLAFRNITALPTMPRGRALVLPMALIGVNS